MMAVRRTVFITTLDGNYYAGVTGAEGILSLPSTRKRNLNGDKTVLDKVDTQHIDQETEVNDAPQQPESAESKEQIIEVQKVEVVSSETHDKEVKEKEQPAAQDESQQNEQEQEIDSETSTAEDVPAPSEEKKKQEETDSEIASKEEHQQANAATEHKKPRFILHVGPMKTVRT